MSTSDRELLERAAKAAGYKVAWEGGSVTGWMAGGSWWNPLTDDGDALRLAVKLRIEIGFSGNGMQTWAVQPYKDVRVHEHIATNADLSAATRRAIVRAAAAIGKETT